MKVLFIIGALGSGGGARQFMELTKRMPDCGITPVICTLNKNQDEYEHFFEEKQITHYAFDRKQPFDLKIVYALVRICFKENIEIIQTWQPLAGTYGLLIAKLTGRPLVSSAIRDARPKNSLTMAIIKNLQSRFSDVFISNTRAGFITHFKQWRENFRVITNGIDLNRFRNMDQRKIDSIRKDLSCEDTFNIGMVANLGDNRDPYSLIKASKLIKQNINRLKVIIIGSGEGKRQAEQLVNDLALSDTVIMLGYKHDIEYYISIFDVSVLLVNASNCQEGISNFLMESMALKKVVVATRGGGNLEWIKDSINGYLVEPNDEEELCEKLLYIKNHDQSSITERAYKRLSEKFSMENYVKAYYDVYVQLMTDRK